MNRNSGGIRGSSYYLPPAMGLQAFAKATGMPQTQRDFYLHTHGLQKVHVADAQEGAVEMATKAVSNLLQEYAIDPLGVDALILYHTMWLLSLEPRTLVGELQQALGLKRACGFSIGGQHCASSLAALRTAQNMIVAGSAKNVVLVGIDAFLGSLNREIPGVTIQGEGASAALVQAGCESNRILSVTTHVDGSFYKGITATEREWEKFNLSYYITGTRLIKQALRKLSLSLEDIALIIPHNTNLSSCEKIRSILSFSEEKIFTDNIRQCGHVCSSDLIINLTDAVRAGKLRKGSFFLMFTVGLGAAWSCAIMQH
jgi:3-oxoacyl-[acyl-carrier-protein] synthase-3